MTDRFYNLLGIRPQISSAKVTNNMGDDERFQNKTLRPILKLQNNLLLAVFSNYIHKHKNAFYSLTLEKRLEYIENVIQKDVKFRNSLKGILIGQFTVEEYNIYIKNSSNLNKRMMCMVIVRLKDQVQLFDTPLMV